MDLRIRNANRNDAEFVAWLILTAGRSHVKRGIWDVILNQTEEGCLRFLELLATTDTSHLFHYSCFLVAEADEGPVSGLSAYDSDTQGYPRLFEALPEVHRKLGKLPTKETAAGKPPRITTCIPPPVEGAWVIESVATLPAFRRKGIVDKLLDHVLDLGRERGIPFYKSWAKLGTNFF